MRKLGWLVVALALGALAPTARADEAKDPWRPLVEHKLKKNRGEQKYIVGWQLSRGLRALRFEVEGSPVEILSVEVSYAKGKTAEWKPVNSSQPLRAAWPPRDALPG